MELPNFPTHGANTNSMSSGHKKRDGGALCSFMNKGLFFMLYNLVAFSLIRSSVNMHELIRLVDKKYIISNLNVGICYKDFSKKGIIIF